jgi:RHS repeat-associated protein
MKTLALSFIALSLLPGFAQSPGDYFLLSNGLAPVDFEIDHDGDGFVTREEYFAGTDPFDPKSFLSIEGDYEKPDFVVRWATEAGSLYDLFSSPGLQNYSLAMEDIAGTGEVIEALMMPDLAAEFFALEAKEPRDSDGDNLSDREEAIAGTMPLDDDTDGDGRKDGDEVFIFLSDPLVFDPEGGTISGTILTDPNNDGDLTDGSPIAGAAVYLDLNFNRRPDPGERSVETNANGEYRIQNVAPGAYHVRQVLPPPNVQSFPRGGVAPTSNLVPDEVLEYIHPAPGESDLDVPYGILASENPAEWGDRITATPSRPVPVELVLKPIGVRANTTSKGTETLALPIGSSLTVRFDELIHDGPGPDLAIYPLPSGVRSEEIDVLLGPTSDALTLLGTFAEGGQPLLLDLADFGLSGPIQVVQLKGKDLGGTPGGYDLAGLEALNFVPVAPDAHLVTIVGSEEVGGKDFGRYFQDLPPTLVIGFENTANRPVRSGDDLIITLNARDDVAIDTVSLTANGNPVILNENFSANVTANNPGYLQLDASATDSAGQIVNRTVTLTVRETDGSLPFDPSSANPSSIDPGTPNRIRRARILSPGSGSELSTDTEVIAEIIGLRGITPEWTLEYAPIDLIDLTNIAIPDPDFLPLSSGNGNRFSEPITTLPAANLADGIYFMRLTVNAPGSASNYSGIIFAKGFDASTLRPEITVTSPSPGDLVSVTREVTGTIKSARPLRDWVIDFAPTAQVDQDNLAAAGPNWKTIASGTEAIDTEQVMAVFDGTILKNDSYILRITAFNEIGLGRNLGLQLEVTGDAKLGRNRIEFVDIDMNLAGFPLRFTRVYDSYQSSENGELGYGWSLQLQDADIRETVPDTAIAGFFGAQPLKRGSRTYITAPTGERLGFTFDPQIGGNSKFGPVYKPTFKSDPGVYYQLEVAPQDFSLLSIGEDGSAKLFLISFPYNPSTYVLIDPQHRRFTYHEDRGFLKAEDLNGNAITLSDAGIVHSSGAQLTFTRDGEGRIISLADPEGGVRSYAYDADGNLATTTDFGGATTTYEYLDDPAHFLSSIKDDLGRTPIRYEYDPESGRLAARIDADGNRNELSWDPGNFTGSVTSLRGFTTQLVYNDRGHIVKETDAEGNITLMTYDDPLNPDLVTSLTNANGHTWKYRYNAMGQVTLLDQPTGHSLTRTYDEMGNLTRVYDETKNVSIFTYDEKGNRLTQEFPDRRMEIFTYSPSGRPVSIKRIGYETTYLEYDGKGQLAKVSDNFGYHASVNSDQFGRVKSVTNANGDTANFKFNRNSVPTEQTDYTGNSITASSSDIANYSSNDLAGMASSIAFDANDLPTSSSLPGGGSVDLEFDPEGNLTQLTDTLGQEFNYLYDHANRLIERDNPTTGKETRTYDAVGNLITLVTADGDKLSFTYDASRRRLTENWHAADDAIIRTFAYTYRTVGQARGVLTVVGETAGTEFTRFGLTHSGKNQLGRVNATYPGQVEFGVVASWFRGSERLDTPDSVGVSLNNQNLTEIQSSFAGGNTGELVWRGSLINPANLSILRRTDGNISTIKRFANGATNPHSNTHFLYNPNGEVTQIRHETPEGELIDPRAEFNYTYLPGGRVATASYSADTATYGYDPAGRLSSTSHTAPALTEENYSYDPAGNRLASHQSATSNSYAAGNRLLTQGDRTFTYTPSGKVATSTDATTGEFREFDYDHRSRLTEVLIKPDAASPATTTVRFRYDYLNRLICREINGDKTWILNDRHMPIAEFKDGENTLSAAFFYSPNLMDDIHAVWRRDEGQKWFMKDHLGSVRATLDSEGVFQSWQDYDSFGQPLTTLSDAVAFAGRFYLPELQLYENRRRYYDPSLGRFLNPDPIGITGREFNYYTYASNNPLALVDPTGTCAAATYGQLASNTLELIDGLCKYGRCLGNLYAGVVEGVVEKIPSTGIISEGCVFQFIPLLDDCGNFDWNVLVPDVPVPPPVKFILDVKATVDGCSSVSFTVTEKPCP